MASATTEAAMRRKGAEGVAASNGEHLIAQMYPVLAFSLVFNKVLAEVQDERERVTVSCFFTLSLGYHMCVLLVGVAGQLGWPGPERRLHRALLGLQNVPWSVAVISLGILTPGVGDAILPAMQRMTSRMFQYTPFLERPLKAGVVHTVPTALGAIYTDFRAYRWAHPWVAAGAVYMVYRITEHTGPAHVGTLAGLLGVVPLAASWMCSPAATEEPPPSRGAAAAACRLEKASSRPVSPAIDRLRARAEALRHAPYRSSSSEAAHTVSMKFHGLHLRDLSPEAIRGIHQELASLTGGGALTFVGEGCVMVTVDLGAAPPAAGPTGLPLDLVDGALGIAQEEGDPGEVTLFAGGEYYRVARGEGGAIAVTPSAAAAAAAAAPLLLVDEIPAPVIVAAEAGASVEVRLSGAHEGDAVVLLAAGEAPTTMRLVAEGAVREVGGGGRAVCQVPAGGLEAGGLWARAVRRGGPDCPTVGAVSVLAPVLVAPTPDAAREALALAGEVLAAHGPAARDALLRDLGEALAPPRAGPPADDTRAAFLSALLEYLALHAAPTLVTAVLAAGAAAGCPPPGRLLAQAAVAEDAELVALLADPRWGLPLAGAGSLLEGADGWGPVHVAALLPDPRVLGALVAARGEEVAEVGLRVRDAEGRTPVELAARAGRWVSVEAIHAAAGAKPQPAPEAPCEPGRLLAFSDPEAERAWRAWRWPHSRRMSIWLGLSFSAMFTADYYWGEDPVLCPGAKQLPWTVLDVCCYAVLCLAAWRARRPSASVVDAAPAAFRALRSCALALRLWAGCDPFAVEGPGAHEVVGSSEGFGGAMVLVFSLRAVGLPARAAQLPWVLPLEVAAHFLPMAVWRAALGEAPGKLARELAPWALAVAASALAVTWATEALSRRAFLRQRAAGGTKEEAADKKAR